MDTTDNSLTLSVKSAMPLSKTLGVLIGFPVISTLISLLLLHQSLLTNLGFDFSNTFRLIVIGWYVVQLYLIYTIVRNEGWSWANIGYSLTKRASIFFFLSYLCVALGLLTFIEYALAHSVLNPERLKAVVSLSPKNTTARVIFIVLAFVAGLTEEFVYRGFAIKALISTKINKWLSVLLAAIPFFFQHGIKAYQLTWGSWYFGWGIVFGCLFLVTKKLYLNIIIHWLVILSAMAAILQAVQ